MLQDTQPDQYVKHYYACTVTQSSSTIVSFLTQYRGEQVIIFQNIAAQHASLQLREKGKELRS